MKRFVIGKRWPAEVGLSEGAALLAAAGVAVGPVVAGELVFVSEDPSGPGRAPLWILSSESPGPDARVVDADAVVVGRPVPLRDEDLELVREAAAAEVRRLGALRAEADVVLPDLPPLGAGKASRDDWGSLFDALRACEAEGLDPVAVGVLPFPFPARDGSTVRLEDARQARQLFLSLFAGGARRRLALDAAALAVAGAPDVGAVLKALQQYADLTVERVER